MADTIQQLQQNLARLEAVLEAQFGTRDPAQAGAMFKASCALADRYAKERDGARAATEALKSKALDAGLRDADVRSAILKALAAPTYTGGDVTDVLIKARLESEGQQ